MQNPGHHHPILMLYHDDDPHHLRRSCWGRPCTPRLPRERLAGVVRSCWIVIIIIIIVQKIMIIMIAILIIVKWSPQHGYDNHDHPHHENSPSSVRPVMELVSAVRWRHFHLFNIQELLILPSATLYCQVTMTVMFWGSQSSEMSTLSQL